MCVWVPVLGFCVAEQPKRTIEQDLNNVIFRNVFHEKTRENKSPKIVPNAMPNIEMDAAASSSNSSSTKSMCEWFLS